MFVQKCMHEPTVFVPKFERSIQHLILQRSHIFNEICQNHPFFLFNCSVHSDFIHACEFINDFIS